MLGSFKGGNLMFGLPERVRMGISGGTKVGTPMAGNIYSYNNVREFMATVPDISKIRSPVLAEIAGAIGRLRRPGA